MIASSIDKTGYYKIAQLVEMPQDSDMSQAEKYSNSPNPLDVTTNPQSKIGKSTFSKNSKSVNHSSS